MVTVFLQPCWPVPTSQQCAEMKGDAGVSYLVHGVCLVAVNFFPCVTGADAEAQKLLIPGFQDHGTASESRRLVLALAARTYPPRSLLREGKPQSRRCLCLAVPS